jgi:3'-phosphoadenosine 5'-phosphosulfate sulfotransferase (PAPS reductase)/FAD synthetase
VKHILGFSGGIDSQAAARYLLNRYPKEDVVLTNSNAGGNEHPITVEHIEWYSANVHPIVRVNAIVSDMWSTPGAAEERGYDGNQVLTFDLMAKIKGRFPSRRMQFCTEKLKLVPQKRWITEMFGPSGPYSGEEFIRYTGVRRDESDARKNAAFREWDTWYDCELYRVIFDWTKKMCFDYVEAHGEKYNELYRLGFGRVGCAPCVNSGKDDIANWAERFPEMIDKVRAWEQRVGRTFFPPCVPGMVMNWIDDVVRWARSARGGRQDMFPIMHEREACESKYGLCE